MSKKLTLLIFLTLPFFYSYESSVAQTKETAIEVNAKVTKVIRHLYAPEAIVPAESGDKIVFIASKGKGLITTPPTDAWIVSKDKVTGIWAKPEKLLDKGICTSIALGNSDSWIIASVDYFKLAALQNLAYIIVDHQKLGDLRGYKHVIEILDVQTREVIMILTSKDFGLPKSEMLKHSRVSPDGKWLSFYTHTYKEQRGIYLYNFTTKKTYHLAVEDDKHPTWTPDGSKILFHHQRGGDAHTDEEVSIEEARLGYYDLKFDGDNVAWQRVLIDPADGPAVYHKHASVYSGTDIVFFHKKHREDKKGKIELSSSSLYARKVEVNSPVYKIKGLYAEDSLEVKIMKHTASAATLKKQSGIFFVGKEEDVKKTLKVKPEYRIYHIENKDVQKIATEITKLESAK